MLCTTTYYWKLARGSLAALVNAERPGRVRWGCPGRSGRSEVVQYLLQGRNQFIDYPFRTREDCLDYLDRHYDDRFGGLDYGLDDLMDDRELAAEAECPLATHHRVLVGRQAVAAGMGRPASVSAPTSPMGWGDNPAGSGTDMPASNPATPHPTASAATQAPTV